MILVKSLPGLASHKWQLPILSLNMEIPGVAAVTNHFGVLFPPISKNSITPTNVNDNNTKFSTKYIHCNPWLM